MKVNVLVDSCGWIEYFTKGALVDKYVPYITNSSRRTHFTPTIVLYEVYRRVKKELGEERAIEACAWIMGYTTVVPLDEGLAMRAASISLEHGLSMADAIIKATADLCGAKIVTGDEHLGKLKDVQLVR
jgi:predicted nucleic acid-binding protein